MNIDRLDLSYLPQPSGSGWIARKLLNEEVVAHEALSVLKEALVDEFNVLGRNLAESSRSSPIRREYLKAGVRSIIRYSPTAGRFAQVVAKGLVREYPEWEGFYLTPPYLIFHLSEDLSEAGSVHSDVVQDSGEMLTWWTPINKRQLSFPALSIFERSHKWLPHYLFRAHQKLGRWILSGDQLLTLIGLKKRLLVPDRESSYFWFSRLLHYGNQNIEDEPHCALVFRISERPLYYEPSNTLADVIDHQFAASGDPSVGELNEILLAAEGLAGRAPDLRRIDSALVEWIRDVRSDQKLKDNRYGRHISFALALVAQRFPGNKLSTAFDLMSFLLGKENLVGLERFLGGLGGAAKVRAMIDILKRELTFGTYQEQVLINRVANVGGPKRTIGLEKLRVYQWI